MKQLTLEWIEAGQLKTRIINDQQTTKHPGSIRIGRDPLRCDVLIYHPTVSGLHVEIFFDARRNSFCLRNLRDSNPPVINKRKLTSGDVVLQRGMSICLGQVEVKVVAIAIGSSQPAISGYTPPSTLPVESARSSMPKSIPPTYGLMCPKCQQLAPYDRLGLGCPWCGTSLASAASILMVPEDK
jgi:predicted component of type VI protein secretion system